MSVALSRFDIQWSAVRAFLGVIRPSYRRVAAQAMQAGGLVRSVRVTVLLDETVEPATLEEIREDVSVATTEIIADLPGDTPMPMVDLVEDVRVITGPLPATDNFADGVIFERWEAYS